MPFKVMKFYDISHHCDKSGEQKLINVLGIYNIRVVSRIIKFNGSFNFET
jgi:hypothetical protein